MRLICPNCSAQYEIEAGMLPDDGRDVQCSNCGHTWFELPPPAAEPSEESRSAIGMTEDDIGVSDDDEAFEEIEALAEDAGEETIGVSEPETEQEPEPQSEPEPEEPEETDDTKEEWLEAAVSTKEQRRPKDVAAVDVLQEEAAREIHQRRSETPAPIETQSELGLQRHKRRDNPSRALLARQARMKSEDTSKTDAPEDGDYRAPRRDLLPDIEEINSSLGPAGEGGSPEAVAANRRGFRYGFLLTAGVAILAVAAYAWAPSIAEALPASEPALIGYVDLANTARDALDRLIAGISGG